MNGTAMPDAPATILIVDDTPANLAVITECLEAHGFQVLIAQDGEEGVKRAEFAHPDLILLDVLMPGMDGFTTCRRLKAGMATRNVPVIFMSALTDTDDKVAGFESGGVDFVTKPFDTAEVLARVNTHLAMSRMRSALATQNLRLQDEISERRKLNEELERRVAERTQALEDALQNSRCLLADKETLLAEVHHRVKNNLQAICTLILLKANQFQDPLVQQAFTDTLARVSSMSLVHEALYSQEDSTTVDFGVYLKRLAETLTVTYGVHDRVRFEVEAEPVGLDLTIAVPVGLIAAEAISNAMKHAFPDGRHGRISIVLRETPVERLLCITDDGSGLWSAEHSSQSAGIGLMKTLASQIAGTITWNNDGGTVMTLKF